MNIKRAFLILLMAAGAMVALAQMPGITEVRHLTRDMGLSSHRVYSIVQGGDQAVWIGTPNGVDRYNGRAMRNYSLQENAYYGDMAARKIQLVNGHDGDILAYDNTGKVLRYSSVYDNFTPYIDLGAILKPGMTLNRIKMADDGTLYVGLSAGLYTHTPDGAVRQILSNAYVNDLCFDHEGLCYVATNDGLYVGNDTLCLKRALDKIAIESVYYDAAQRQVVIGTFNDGLWTTDVATGSTTLISDRCSDPIRSIVRFADDALAIGIDGDGVYLYYPVTGQLLPLINTDDSRDFNIRGNGIYALSTDAEGNLWIGSYTGGASLVKFTPTASKSIVHEKGNPNSLANNNVNAIVQSANGDIWYATDMGVSVCRANGQWEHALSQRVCVSLCPVGQGTIAVGTYGAGVFIVDQSGRVVANHNKQNSGLTSNNIFSIVTDHQGDIWVAGIDGNLMCFDSAWHLRAQYPIVPVFSIVSIDHHRVAASTVNGFYIIDKSTGKFTQYATFEEQSALNMSAYTIPMVFNADGTVWLGTSGGGLNLYDISSRRILKGYKRHDGLPSNDVFGLLKTANGDLWIGTGKGVAILRDDKIVALNYTPGNENECNKLSVAQLANGDIVFGSTEGAIRFTPTEINKVDFQSPLAITQFKIEGMKADEAARLAPEIYQGVADGVIRLAHDDNSFVVTFEAINLKYQDDIAYKYYLENYDTEWNESVVGEAAYKKLNPGKYLLHIASVHRSDGTVIDERTIAIIVSQPWFNTWWAWVIYLLVACMAVAWAIRHKLDRMQKRYYQEKIRFFINTAHDIRTPVTLAMAPLEDAKKDDTLSEDTAYLINTASRNVKKLNAITTQLLDFEKFDSAKYTVQWQRLDLCQVLSQEAQCFADACRRKGIEMSLQLPQTPACIDGDLTLIEHVFDNLISNACKYNKTGGSIAIDCQVVKDNVVVTIADSGIGIPKHEHKYIFSDIHRGANARHTQEIGTGFGLLQVKRLVERLKGQVSFKSAENKGTVFTLVFKKSDGSADPISRQTPTATVCDEILASIPDTIAVSDTMAKDATVLIVEDNDDMRHYLGRQLGTMYNVVLKASADEAIADLDTTYPDLIISDVMMPGMQGDDFCDYVKSNPDTAGIPIILLTAKAEHDAVVAGLKKGADDYLTKPFSIEILLLKVQGILDNRQRLRQYLLQRSVTQALEPIRSAAEAAASQSEPAADGAEAAEVAMTPSDQRFVEKATAIVMANIADAQFTIEQLCREMAMSRTLFYGRLKSLTGKAPQEFMRLLRLERAAEMLRAGASVYDTAEATGFGNVKYFSTIFKKHFGLQPSKYSVAETPADQV